MKNVHVFPFIFLAGASVAAAQSTSTGATATLLHAPAGDSGGGGQVTGPTVTSEISVGDAASGIVTNVSANGVVAKGNFIGQLYQTESFAITATPPVVAEGDTAQLSGRLIMDDDTFLPVPAGEIAWSVRSGLVAGLTTGGLVLTAPVIRPTDVLFDGTYKSLTDPDGTLLNVNDLGETDFFQQYAGDRIDDGWQLEYFGLPPNARAAPTADADGDGRDNWMEFLSGFSPVDSKAFLDFKIQGFSSANVMDFRINKVLPGRTYIVRANTDLQSFPQTVGSPIDVPAEQTNLLFQDPAASEGKKFYFLQITRH